jgi:antirestriction protein
VSKAPETVETIVAPAIYVADLAAYNSAILHGKWIRLAGKDSDEVNEEINLMLSVGRQLYGSHTLSEKHEEFAIHDYEGFGPIKIGEYDTIDGVLEHVERMDDDPDKYFAYIDATGGDGDGYVPDDASGPYDNEEEFAWEMMDMITGDKTLSDYLESKGIPGSLAMAIEFDAKDFMFSGRCNGEFSTGSYGGKHYVFY